MAPPEETRPPLQGHTKLEKTKLLLNGLAALDPGDRQDAAKAIYVQGYELVRHAVQNWLNDTELASFFITSETSFPETTVGIAVEPSRFEEIRQANGSPRLADVPPDIDAKEFELNFSDRIHIDVLTTRDRSGEGTIARFLNRNGEGIQQVELAVRNIQQTTALLQSRMGLDPLYFEARPGADDTLVNFFLVDFLTPTSDKKKLLIELIEARGPRPHV